MKKETVRNSTLRITITALFMALNIVLSMSIFSIPVPGGHLYLCDVIICLASILLNPLEAFVVGGIGSFIGDFLFYPAPMFVSLATHGLQAIVISLFSHSVLKHKPRLSSGIGCLLGGVIMVIGYSLGRAYVYATLEYAIIKLPFEILQAVVGIIVGMLLCWKCGIHKLFVKTINRER